VICSTRRNIALKRRSSRDSIRVSLRSGFFPDRNDTFHVFSLRAAREKIRRLVANGKNESDAALVEAVDRERSASVKHSFGVDGTTRSTYDLMINTATGEDNAISTILHAMDRVEQGKEVVDNRVDLTLWQVRYVSSLIFFISQGKGRRSTSWPLSKSIVWLATGELNVPTVNAPAHWPAARSAFC